MPFCTNCGNQVGGQDRFCAKCGCAQGAGAPAQAGPGAGPGTGPPPPAFTGAARIRPNHAALLCYIPEIGWIASVIFLSVDPYRNNRYIRFHALQALFLAVLNLVARIVFVPFPAILPFHFFGVRHMLQLAVVIAQIVGIVRTARNEDYRLPLLSELAEKSMV